MTNDNIAFRNNLILRLNIPALKPRLGVCLQFLPGDQQLLVSNASMIILLGADEVEPCTLCSAVLNSFYTNDILLVLHSDPNDGRLHRSECQRLGGWLVLTDHLETCPTVAELFEQCSAGIPGG